MTEIALITGAAQGIGRELTRRFLSQGWRVAGLDVDAEALAELASLHAGAPLLPLAADVGSEADVAQAPLTASAAGSGSPASRPVSTSW